MDMVINFLNNSPAKKKLTIAQSIFETVTCMHEMSSVIVRFVEVEDRSFATYQLSLVILNSV